QPRSVALMTAARITALRPGASPPPVEMAMRRVWVLMAFPFRFCAVEDDSIGLRREGAGMSGKYATFTNMTDYMGLEAQLSDEARQVRETARAFVNKEVLPVIEGH